MGLFEVYTIPIVNRWQHPCYSHLPTAISIVVPQRHRPLKDVLENLTRKSEVFAVSSERLRDKYYVSIFIVYTHTDHYRLTIIKANKEINFSFWQIYGDLYCDVLSPAYAMNLPLIFTFYSHFCRHSQPLR